MRWEDDLREELEAYVAQETDDNVARGMTPEAARAAALRKLGNRTRVHEAIHEMRTMRPLDALWKDLTYGARLLLRAPAFSLAAILSLALGIGANTAIFQLLDAVRLRALPVDRPEQLVEITLDNFDAANGQFNGRDNGKTNPIWEQLRDRQEAFSSVLAWSPTTFNLAPAGERRDVAGLWVSGGFFTTLGVRPLLGRLFTPADDRPGCGTPGAVISYAFWQREFGGAPDVLARTIAASGQAVPIVGVTPPAFFGTEVGRHFDIAIPICSRPTLSPAAGWLDRRDFWWLTIMGRLKPGWSLDRANAHLDAISPGIFDATLPPTYRPIAAKAYLSLHLRASSSSSGVSDLRERYERPLVLLMALVGLVLLVACANLANLLLARATAREREIAVRLAIGASRARLVAQLLVESLMLAAIGAVAGLILAHALSAMLVAWLGTPRNPVFLDLSLDWRTLAFTGGIACVTCVLFGLAPALVATRREVSLVMRSGGRGLTPGRERFSMRRALVVSQIALSLVLVAGALLFMRTLQNLTTTDTGFRSDGVLVTSVTMRSTYSAEQRAAMHQRLLEALRAIHGVNGVAQVYHPPFNDGLWNPLVFGDGPPTDPGQVVSFNHVSPGYFQVMGMPLRAGRDFSDRDTSASRLVAIVNERLVRDLFKGANPVGRTLRLGTNVGEPDRVFEIIGIVGDSKMLTMREETFAGAYMPTAQYWDPRFRANFVVRTAADRAMIARAVAQTVARVGPTLSLRIDVLDTQIAQSLQGERVMARLSGGFGLLASLLAIVGIYGLVAYTVTRRESEIGVRLALGAQRRDIWRLVLGEIALLLVAGVLVGIPLTLAAGRSARTLLFGLEPHDPITLGLAVLLLAAASLLACAIPARRASHTDPVVALRES